MCWTQFFYTTFMELFDIHTVIHSFTALETSRVFSIFSCSKQKRLFFSVWTLAVRVTFYSKVVYFTLTFTNVLYCFGHITRLLERIKSANGQILTSSLYSQEILLVRYADGETLGSLRGRQSTVVKGTDSGLGEARGPGSSGGRWTCDSQTVFSQVVNSHNRYNLQMVP